ncbi:amino acid adenylation domain-containing protein [Stigmatella sp. ncwal1]|uniref:Amino acid adenylation domain-containing protein n=1 Tax=Stigmatella ashevillensis TaxID=2995309 RepID=A0ABT5D183_9BACT|nr:non-ribosomal peptide synthetase [Stigmatella ashevillena]MDC0707423.1 amino acid adenylation domain-containing protein [Stigmatella ashevillena]
MPFRNDPALDEFRLLSREEKLQRIAALIEEKKSSAKSSASSEAFALTDLQEAFSAGRMIGPVAERVGCHFYLELNLPALDVARLREAWKALLVRHAMLRGVVLADGQQRICSEPPGVEWVQYDKTGVTARELSDHLSSIRGELAHKLYAPGDWPLYEIRITHAPGGWVVVHLSMDEWIIDATSLNSLLAEWRTLYERPQDALPPLDCSFQDYVVALRRFEATPQYQEGLDYWLAKIESPPSGPVLSKRPTAARGRTRARRTFSLDERSWSNLLQQADVLGVSPTVLVLTAFTETLSRRSVQKRFALILTYSHRLPFHPHVERIVGPFTSTGLFVADEGASRTLAERAQSYQRQLWDDLDHGQVSSVRVLRALRTKNRLAADAVFPVVFTSMLGLAAAEGDTGWLGSITYMVTQTPQVHLDCQVSQRNGRLYVHWDIAEEEFAPGTIDELFHQFQSTVSGWAALHGQAGGPGIAASIEPPALLTVSSDSARRDAEFPLTDVQQAYLVGRGPSGGSDTSCQIYQEFEATDLDVLRLEAAWQALIDGHEMLRATLQQNGRQRIQPRVEPYRFQFLDLRARPDQGARLDAIRREMTHAALPLEGSPLFAIRVSRLDETQWRVHFAIDTLIADGPSIALLFEEWFARYADPSRAVRVPRISYRDYCVALQRFRTTPLAAEHQAHWERRLAAAPGGLPPALRGAQMVARTAVPKRERRSGVVPEWQRLKEHAERWGLDPEIVALTAFCEVLAQPHPNQSFTVVVVDWRRLAVHPEIGGVVGDFTGLNWLVHDAVSGLSFLERVRRNTERLEADQRCSAVSGLSALRKLMRGGAPDSGVFPVVFTKPLPRPPFQLPANISTGLGISHTPNVLLDNIHFEIAGQLHFHWDAIAGSISAETLDRTFMAYQRLLTRLAAESDWEQLVFGAPGGPSPALEDALPPRAWNVTQTSYPLERCLHEWLEEQVDRTPDLVAVRQGARSLTFRELDQEANRWAHALRGLGVQRDSLVAVMAERSLEMVVALVAVLKAGGAYLPFDPGYPEERLKLMAEDARPRVLLTQRSFDHLLRSFGEHRLSLDGDPAERARQPVTRLGSATGPDNLAYVIYTSGSTGKPKGCMVSHRAICNRLLWMQSTYPISQKDRVLQKTPFTFDVSVWEFFWPLMTGAEMVLASPGGHRDSRYLATLIQEAGITTCHFVPGMLGLFLDEPQAVGCVSLRQVFTSGEALPSAVMERCLRALPAKLHNLYGPTEAAVDVTFWECRSRTDGKVPIGRPIANTQIFILDEAMREVAVGAVGELHIGGVNLARGYLNRPELTGGRFVPDPVSGSPGARLYKTGDLARYLPDGEIEFLGRADFQIKLRGNRIELGEIETTLGAHPDVEDAVVVVRDHTTTDPKLVAYSVPRRGRRVDTDALRTFLRERLPAAMIPNALVELPELPRTRHGKIDRDALPWPVGAPTANRDGVVDSAQVEADIAGFFRDALQCQDVNVTKDVFDLGATSFTIVKLAQWLEQTKSVAVPLELFLKNPTIRGIASHVGSQGSAPKRAAPVADAASDQVSFFSAEERQRFKDRALHLRHDVEGLPSLPLGHLPEAPDAYVQRGCPERFLPGSISFDRFSAFLSLLRQGGAQGHPRYLYPSAGALYAVQVHLYVKPGAIEGMSGGTYYLHPVDGRLYQLSDAVLDRRHHFYYNRPHFDDAGFALFLVAQPEAIAPIYGEASLVLAALEAGYMGQLLMMRQAEFNLGLRPIGAINVDQVRSAFQLNASHIVVHSLLGGRMEYGAASVTRATHSTASNDIAIVGMAGRYPQADTLEQFWGNLSSGHRAIRPMPENRGRTGSVRSAGFLEHIDRFDHLFFGIAPAEARAMDPQERLLLTVMWETLENAGYAPESFNASARKVGVFVGVMWSDYQNVGQAEWQRSGQAKAYSMHSAIANRISHVLNLRGPSVALDTSCSSALTALHLASESIRRGECDAALVGGVNLLAHPYHLSLLSSLGLVTESGRSCAFGADGTGWAAGEGVGAVLIRRLTDAEREGDIIHAVLKGTSIAHLGGGRGFGHPNPTAQAVSIRDALFAAGVAAETIGYVETAATGASMADAAEIAALNEVLGPRRSASGPCLVGSVKPNIGHLEAASGISQLTKVLLQLRHGSIAPTIDSEPQSPLIRPDPNVLAINRTLVDWPRSGEAPRRALINAFGSTGSCAHAVIEAYTGPSRRAPGVGSQVIVLSAATAPQVTESAQRLADHFAALPSEQHAPLVDIAFTLATGRLAMPSRLALVVENVDDLIEKLRGAASGARAQAGVHRGEVADAGTPRPPHLEGFGPDDVARRWVEGKAVDWKRLFPSDARRTPLPTYPFAQSEHWLAGVSETVGPAPEPVSTVVKERPAATDLERQSVRNFLAQVYAEESEIPVVRVEPHVRFERLGLNSYLVGKLNARLVREGLQGLPKTLFYERQTIEELAQYLSEKHGDRIRDRLEMNAVRSEPEPLRQSAPSVAPTGEAVAIVGVAGRYPMAEDLDQLWENLAAGRDCIIEIPAQRWDHRRYFDPRRGQPGKTYCKWGGFIEDVDCFDPLFFGITPRDAEWIDPQERLFLETAWSTVEDAGYTRETLKRSTGDRVGVFVGVMYGEYQLFGAAAGSTPVGLAYGSIANRVSYCLDVSGPSLAVDTLCSSSLTAIHLAVESLRRGECAAAIAGGVNLSLHPSKYLLHAQAQMSASDGRCRSFGAGGDGFSPGEGVGAVLLKPLTQAEADGDHIYAIIRSTAANHGGRTSGYTVPNPQAQAQLIQQALTAGRIDPASVSYIEAHGTGTSLGDPIEAAGLIQALSSNGRDRCAIGSIKSNIGHLESAAGIAALTKVLLQMRHGRIAPSLHSQVINPNIDFSSTPFYVPQELTAWEAGLDGAGRPLPRRAGISSFGAGGANAHLVIEEYQVPASGSGRGGPQLLVLSARTDERLRVHAGRLAAFLMRNGAPRLEDVAHTSRVGREALARRIAVVASTHEEAARALLAFSRGESHRDVILGVPPAGAAELAAPQRPNGLEPEPVRLHRLGASWASGADISWNHFGLGAGARRVSLPTYPFERRRYWLPDRAVSSPVPGPVDGGGQVLLYRPEWKPLQAEASSLGQARPVLVFDTSDAFIRAWKGDPTSPQTLVLPGRIFRRRDEFTYEIDPNSKDDFHQLTWELMRRGLMPRSIVYRWAEPNVLPGDSVDDAFFSVFWLTKALMVAKAEGVDLVYVHSVVDGSRAPRFTAMAAFAKSLRREEPGFRYKTLEVGADLPVESIAALVAGELAFMSSEHLEVRYAEGRRWVKALVPYEVPSAQAVAVNAPARPVYLLTGGTGAIGLLLAEHLVQTEGARVALVGRTPPDAARGMRIEKLRSLGAEVLVLQADVSRPEEVAAAVFEVKRHFSAIHGVIHAAGTLRDSLIRNKTAEDARAVLSAKIAGVLALDEATRHEELTSFVCISSLAGATGNSGQCDYAYANAYLDEFTMWREQQRAGGLRHGVTRSILWPLWAEGGMRVSSSLMEDVTRRTGMMLLPSEQALSLWSRVTRSGPTVSVPLYGDPAKIRSTVEGAEQPPAAVPSTPPSQDALQATRELLTRIFVEDTKIAAEDWDGGAHFSEYGIDSLAVGRITRRLESFFGPLPQTLLLDHPTLRDLSGHLASRQRAPVTIASPASVAVASRPAMASRRDEPGIDDIAIVGFDGRYPGASTPEALWNNLRGGVQSITRVPPNRWDADAYGQIYCASGGFLDGVEDFDYRFFHINPAEAKQLHPEERLLLQCVWSTVERAACGLAPLREERTGVFVGVTSLTYPLRAVEQWVAHRDAPPDVTTYSLANRLSHFFNWVGPSMVVDTACSSSLVALHLACESLRRGECDAVVAAGANLYLHPAKYLRMCQNRLLATRTRGIFAQDGDGFVPGEGIGSVLLMPLRRALDARYTIHGVIKASGVSHSGRTTSFLAPSAQAQMALQQKVLRKSGLSADRIGYVELQAMGSTVADAVEWSALKQLFEARGRERPCVLGSIKPNIGHLEAASGMAQLTKVLLQMRHGEFAPSHFAETLNRDIVLEGAPFQLQRELAPWRRVGEEPRAALLSSLGAGGMQACVVVQEYSDLEARMTSSDVVSSLDRPELFPISARTEEQLREAVTQLRSFVAATDEALASIAFTLQVGREAFQHRLILVAASRAEFLRGLDDFLGRRELRANVFSGMVTRLHESPPVDPAEVQASVERRDLPRLGQLWTLNVPIDWAGLRGGGSQRRVLLPTYPFDKRRCWVPEEEEGTVVSRYYDHFATDTDEVETHLVFAPLRERPPGFSWLRTFVEPGQHRAEYERMVAAQRDMKDLLLSRLAVSDRAGFRVLDIGCGLGTDLIGLAQRHPTLQGHGHTVSPKQAEACHRKIARLGLQDRLEVWCRDSARGDYADTYDAIIGFEVTFHIADKDGLFSRIARHLKPEGRLMLVDVVAATITEIDAAHLGQHTSTQRQFAENLAAHGLEIIEVIDASAPVGRFLDDPGFEENLAHLSAVHPALKETEPEHRGWHRFGVGLRMGLFRYVLLEIRKARLATAALVAHNEAAFAHAAAYPGESAQPGRPALPLEPSPSALPDGSTVEQRLRELVTRILEYRDGDLDGDARFTELGMSSLQQVLLVEEVNRTFGLRLKAHSIYDHSSIRELARHLGAADPRRVEHVPVVRVPREAPQVDSRTQGEDIAVIGLSARFPGARNATVLWENLIKGVDSVGEVPSDRWSLEGFYDPQGGTGRSVSKWAGFIDEIDRFDPLFFNIAPTEAEVMDPQQRIFLEACWHALEDAGHAGARLSGLRCGVYAGVTSSDYSYRVGAPAVSEQLAQAMLGNDHSILAARIAYHLNLKGPTMALNTACSSSLVAVHLACQSLLRGETDMMLAGGVSLYLNPNAFVIMSQAGILSPGGRCRTFSAGADGIAVGEGVGVVVLKKLDKALADGDHIYGVIKGSGTNQDGKTNGITAPSAESQSTLERSVYERFGINPETLTYVEAHGTGTLLGDPIEVSALTSAFAAHTSKRGFCAIGSIKSNIGHTSAAAGVAGLIKVLLALDHGMLPPTLHVTEENPHIDFEGSPFYVNRLPRPWQPGFGPRRAAISAFGFSGTNCHMVVEQPPSRRDSEDIAEVVLPLSAQSNEQLRELVERLRHQLSDAERARSLSDIAYTLQMGRRDMPRRLALVVSKRREGLERLKEILAGGYGIAGVYRSDEAPASQDTSSSLAHALAACWAQGEQVDWMRLHEGQQRRRVSLPTYPFARQRFWVEDTPREHGGAPGPITRRLLGSEFYLTDHVVEGHKVLPGVMSLEFARAACEGTLGAPARIESMVWTRPVRHSGAPLDLEVHLTPGHGSVDFELVDGRTKEVYSQGRLVQGGASREVRQAELMDVRAVKARMTLELEANAVYSMFAARGVVYGPRMRSIARLHGGENEALAELAPLPRSGGLGLDPWWMDGALQTILGLSVGSVGDPSMLRLPFSLGALELLAPLSAVRFAHARPAAGSAVGSIAKFDLSLLDSDGRVIARMRELALRGASPRTSVALPRGDGAARGPTTAKQGTPRDVLEWHLRTVFSRVIKLPPEQIDPAEPFETYGIDSLLVTRLTRELAKDFGSLSMTLLFEWQTLGELANHLAEHHGATVARIVAATRAGEPPANEAPTRIEPERLAVEQRPGVSAMTMEDGIAIIGLSGRYPQAPTLEDFWNNLREGRDCIVPVPKERWDVSRYFNPDRTRLGSIYTRWGGFLEDADKFDPLFFNIPPSDAGLLDPQERLFLETAWATIEDAGYTRARLGRRVGVFVGVMYGEYQFYGVEDLQAGGTVALNSSYASIANRVSYSLNLQGPSLAVDTMCSSALTAIHLACSALRQGECEAAIAGGVNLSVHPNKYLNLSQGQFASSDGRCRSFGEGGDGYVPGEGVGAVLLKPLSRALADGDRVLGVIRGSALNHGGKTNGYTVPNPKAQGELIETVLRQSGIEPRTISFVEAHGTGTSLGDPIELSSLTHAFRRFTEDRQFCAIGSVKSNIGHLESAAGIAALTKVLLQMRHRTLVPTLHVDSLNPHIDFVNSPFRVQRTAAPWLPITLDGGAKSTTHGLRAAISSFGAGGSNAHLIIEDWTPPAREAPASKAREAWLILLSARDEDRLAAVVRRLRDHLVGEGASLRLDDIAHTLYVGREQMDERLALVVASVEDLISALTVWLDGKNGGAVIHRGRRTVGPRGASQEAVRYEGTNLEELARRWVQGAQLPLDELPRDDARIIALPTYPFARESHWFVPTAARPKIQVFEQRSPLLGGTTEPTGAKRSSMSIDRDSVGVRGHEVAGRAIVPAATLLEKVRAAATGAEEISLRNVAFIEPIDVTAGALDVEIHLKPTADEGVLEFEFTSASQGGEATRVHAQGRVVRRRGPASSEAPERIDLDAVRARCTASQPGAEVYARFHGAGLDYGSSFQVIHTLHGGPTDALALLVLPAEYEPQGQSFALHPVLLDGAFQAVVGLSIAPSESRSGPATVPFAVGEVELLGTLPSRCWAHVVRSVRGTSTGLIHEFDIRLLDDSGSVLAKISRLVSRPMAVPESGTHYFRTAWRHAVASSARAEAHQTTLVLDTVEEVRTALRDPERVVLVRPAHGFRRVDRHHYEVNPRSEADFIRLFDALGAEGLKPERIHHLWPLRTTERPWLSQVDEELTVGFHALFFLVRALMRQRDKKGVRLLSVNEENAEGGSPLFTGISAFLRSVALEDSAIRGSVLSLPSARDLGAERMAQLLTSEADGKEPEVRFEGAVRKVKRIEAVGRPGEWNDLPLKNRGRYLITGGLGGLGGIVSTFLARQFKARLLLCGRSPLDAAGAEHLRRLEAVGGEVHYFSADIGETASCRRLAAEARGMLGGLDGIFQVAGVLRDSLLRSKSFADAEQVLHPKIHGTVNLDAAFADEPLDFFVLFSSLAGVMGNAGQSDYAFANGFLDRFAEVRNVLMERGQRSGRTLSINWPLWDGGGMRLAPEERRWLTENLGLTPLSPAAGLMALADALRLPHPQLLVIAGDSTRVRALTGSDRADSSTAVSSTRPLAETSPGPAVIPSEEAEPRQSIERWLSGMLQAELHLGERLLRSEMPFEQYGLDSVRAMRLTRALEAELGELAKTLFYEYPSIRELAGYLLENHREPLERKLRSAATAPTRSSAPAQTTRTLGTAAPLAQVSSWTGDIAIIGVAGRYPQAENLEAFWENLREGRDSITEIPATRWDLRRNFDSDRSRSGKSYGKWGSFLDGVDHFDPLFFSISPKEAEWMDPQERLFLQTAWHAIENAGYTRARIGRGVGVYVGVMNSDYQLHGAENGEAGQGMAVSGSYAAIANRVSFFFDFAGPSIALDTMCSSSLVALHLACEAIRSGDIELALAGGVNVSVHPQKYVNLSSGQFLSTDGRCRSFGAGGDGYVPGEGVGAVLLKPLDKAIRDGDYIHAVIKGSAINHGGRVNGYTVPNPNAQADVIARALTRSGVSAADISYIEAHGTGTSLGDPIEIAGLDKVFRQAGAKSGSCAIGSVKSNIGHLEAAAGIAGLTKLLLQLRHRELVPSLHSGQLNPNIRFEGSPFTVQRTLAPWSVPSVGGTPARRLAGLSAFGAGGVNAHFVIEESPHENRASVASSGLIPVVLSARTEASLVGMLKALQGFLRRPQVSLVDLAFTLARGRDAMEHRLVLVASDLPELSRLIEQALAGRPDPAVFRGRVPVQRESIAREEGRSLDVLARLWTSQVDFDWSTLSSLSGGRIRPLPGYCFDTRRYWLRTPVAEPRNGSGTGPPPDEDFETLALLRGLSQGALSIEEVDARMTAGMKQ